MLTSILRTVLLYLIIIIAVRLMGKRQIGDMQTTELVVTFLISDIAAIPMENNGNPLLSGLIPIFVLIICEITISIVMLKSTKFRRIVCGRPIIIISHGKILQNELKRLRMSTEDLFEQLRLQEVFSLDEVEYAIIETNGSMSVLKKAESQPVTCSNLNIKVSPSSLETVVISDGVICESSCKFHEITKSDIYKEIEGKNISIKDIFIMTASDENGYRIILKEKQN